MPKWHIFHHHNRLCERPLTQLERRSSPPEGYRAGRQRWSSQLPVDPFAIGTASTLAG
jgi:hypothetical protein